MSKHIRVWQLNVTLPVYYDLMEGKKRVETRAPEPGTEKDYGEIKWGDILIFNAIGENPMNVKRSRLRCMANGIRRYSSLEEMFQHEDFSKIAPQSKSVQEAIKTYDSFPGVKERIEKYGIIAVDLIKIDTIY
ncbi:hypothetical protein HZA33_04570 [Candidatus Pacearchaeota archaeon]|nr:hypothetical protein [Candidatus Pacearchaeota archaeon]